MTLIYIKEGAKRIFIVRRKPTAHRSNVHIKTILNLDDALA